jgi:hypothetical protein
MNHRTGATLSAGSLAVLPTVRFSSATTVEFIAAAKTRDVVIPWFSSSGLTVGWALNYIAGLPPGISRVAGCPECARRGEGSAFAQTLRRTTFAWPANRSSRRIGRLFRGYTG